MYKPLKICYRLISYPFRMISNIVKPFFNFWLPNVRFFIQKRIKYKGKVVCNQKTLFTGLGTIHVGKNCVFGYKLGGFFRGGSVELQPRYKNATINIGDNIATNNNLFMCAANYIEIGTDTLIGQNVTIMDFEAHGIKANQRREIGEIGKVILGKNIWIGNNVTILKNTTIGDNTIVATGAVVKGGFPSNVIIGGVPAKIIKKL